MSSWRSPRLVRLIDLFTGVNSQIITFSDYFRFNIFAILILAIFNIIFNYLFIVTLDWGLLGVATATFISLTLYNAAKFVFIMVRMKLQPFTSETLKIIAVGGICFALSWLPVDTVEVLFIDMMILPLSGRLSSS